MLAQEITPSRRHEYRGEEVIGPGYRAIWFLFNGLSYDIGRFYRPDGTWTGFYVDILEPVRWERGDPATLQPITDLFLDIWIAPDRSFEILDEDEFDAACRRGNITPRQAEHARRTLADLTPALLDASFPPPEVVTFQS